MRISLDLGKDYYRVTISEDSSNNIGEKQILLLDTFELKTLGIWCRHFNLDLIKKNALTISNNVYLF